MSAARDFIIAGRVIPLRAMDRLLRFWPRLCAGLIALVCVSAAAQTATPKGPGWDGHLIWVLPFENNSSQRSVDWIGASFPDIMNQRLGSAGFLTIRREDRRDALVHLGLPADFHPTQASAYRIAQTLDADYVIFGNYTVANGNIVATARVLSMSGPILNQSLVAQGKLDQLIEIEDELAWKTAMQIDPELDLDKQTFLAAGGNLSLSAFENYTRGQLNTDPDDRISHLTRAVQISPSYLQAWFSLGRAYLANEQYEECVAAFARIPRGNRLWLEATFFSGICHLYTGDDAKAENQFAAIASVLPMPEVLNNEGVAISRAGRNGTPLFQRAVKLDPRNADYWFNLAVSQWKAKNNTEALKAVNQSLNLQPQNDDTADLKNILMGTGALPAAGGDAPDADPEDDPQERVATSYDESSFRQAAFELEQINALKIASLPPQERSAHLCRQGHAYVENGLLLEAERQFQLALRADPHSAAAHAGLAEVHEDAGSAKLAKEEANKSLQEQPNVPAYLVLARLALEQHAADEAAENAHKVLELDPNNTAAKGLLHAISVQKPQPTPAQQ